MSSPRTFPIVRMGSAQCMFNLDPLDEVSVAELLLLRHQAAELAHDNAEHVEVIRNGFEQ